MGDINWEKGEIKKLGTSKSPYYKLRKSLRRWQKKKKKRRSRRKK